MPLPIGVLDFETDPFEYGRIPYPFACGIYFAEKDYCELWEPHIIEKVIEKLRSMPKCVLYAHNGGKFDFHYLIEDSNPGEIVIRNGRVTQMQIGKVILKDSWPLMPFPLAEYQKTKIDYRIFRKEFRNLKKNRAKIAAYLKDDCRDLLNLVRGFQGIVGDKDTIGAAAFYQMRKLGIKIISANESHDETFRPYYFGGRTEAFQRGVFRGNFQYLDINSAYPYAMIFNHPTGTDYLHGRKLPKNPGACFVRLIGKSAGALPLRSEDGSLNFPCMSAEFCVTGWEIKAGLDTGTLKIDKILDVWTPRHTITFAPYVNTFFPLKAKAKADGDKIHYLAYKYLTTSGYGKFAQNPRDFKDHILAPYGEDVEGYDWDLDFGAVSLWSKPSYHGWGFYDVATAASITGFVRAMLWRAASRANRLFYGDTDSMICQQLSVPKSLKLGDWKRESCSECGKSDTILTVAIAGKKLYGIKYACGHTVVRSKGARLTWSELLEVCSGKAVKWRNAAPTFSLGGAHFIERTIRTTGD